jgi:hypothetical protein
MSRDVRQQFGPVGAPIWSAITVRRSRSFASLSMVRAKLPPRAA